MYKQINKNYIYLVILIVLTLFLTLLMSHIYLSKNKLVSEFYEYSNKITVNEFDSYITENSETLIYISDKFDLTNEKFEERFKNKIESLNIKGNVVYIDKNEINDEFINSLHDKYNINIDESKFPLVLIIVEGKITKNIYVNNDTDVDNFINYEVFQ